MRFCVFDSPLGPVGLAASDAGLVRVKLACPGEQKFAALLENEFGRAANNERDCEILKKATGQLGEYFKGYRTKFEITIELEVSDFTRKVLDEVARIPYGKTATYGRIARRVGNRRASRAVGRAVGANPLPLLIPCHRVIAADGLGGFGAGLELKKRLLRLEGALDSINHAKRQRHSNASFAHPR